MLRTLFWQITTAVQLVQARSTPPGTNWERIFSALVAASTLVYAGLTAYLVVETRRMRRVQTEPKVGVSIVPSADAFGFADLLVRNDGAGRN
jgi:hypothetical protein